MIRHTSLQCLCSYCETQTFWVCYSKEALAEQSLAKINLTIHLLTFREKVYKWKQFNVTISMSGNSYKEKQYQLKHIVFVSHVTENVKVNIIRIWSFGRCLVDLRLRITGLCSAQSINCTLFAWNVSWPWPRRKMTFIVFTDFMSCTHLCHIEMLNQRR